MPDSFLDHIPSHERERIRKRMRSPEAYERLREKVKGPEDLEREMEKNSESADLSFSLETNEKFQERAKNIVRDAVREQGIDAFQEGAPNSLAAAIERGVFDVTVDHSKKEPRIAVRVQGTPKQSGDLAMGTVSEVYPLKTTLQQTITSTLSQSTED